MTTAVIIGYIALFAVAIQTGIIMIIFIRQALARRSDDAGYMEAVIEGSVARLRPKLMTVACATLSLLPIMFLNGPGVEIMRPIATPTIRGMLSSSIYVLFLIPCLFAVGQDIERWWQRKHRPRRACSCFRDFNRGVYTDDMPLENTDIRTT
jgi:Cu(I)/Ag(I) efflux system membrane protein CusA/SilA